MFPVARRHAAQASGCSLMPAHGRLLRFPLVRPKRELGNRAPAANVNSRARSGKRATGHQRSFYDNESGKGDHRHIGGAETTYVFVSVDQLLDDFLADVATWKGE